MKILHILRSELSKITRTFIYTNSHDAEISLFPLYQGEVDYDQLVKEIFENDSVLTWW